MSCFFSVLAFFFFVVVFLLCLDYTTNTEQGAFFTTYSDTLPLVMTLCTNPMPLCPTTKMSTCRSFALATSSSLTSP